MAKYVIDEFEFDSAEDAAEYIIPDDDYDEDEFRGWINDEGTVDIGGCSFIRSEILESMDPIAYNEALTEWINESLYERRREVIRELESIDNDEESRVEGYWVFRKADEGEENDAVTNLLNDLFG